MMVKEDEVEDEEELIEILEEPETITEINPKTITPILEEKQSQPAESLDSLLEEEPETPKQEEKSVYETSESVEKKYQTHQDEKKFVVERANPNLRTIQEHPTSDINRFQSVGMIGERTSSSDIYVAETTERQIERRTPWEREEKERKIGMQKKYE